MKTIDTTDRNETRFVGELFTSPAELMETLDSRSHVYGDRDALTRRDNSGWTGYTSAKAFREDFLASNVSKAIVQSVEARLRNLKTQERKRVQFYGSVEGFQPIVPLALMGVPESMINSRMVQSKSRIINVAIDCTASCYVSAADIAKASTELVGAVSGLEKQGYRVNLTALVTFSTRKETSFVGVQIKSANQPLNLSRIMFPFSTAGFQRRAGFAWYERKSGIHHENGYGTPLRYEKGRKEALAQVLGPNTVLICTADIAQGNVNVESALKEAVACQ